MTGNNGRLCCCQGGKKERTMNVYYPEKTISDPIKDGPQSAMEKALLEAYLQQKGYHLADLAELPEAQIKALMTEASQYASLRLAEVESMAHFREKIHQPD
jgi:hypothetical protein